MTSSELEEYIRVLKDSNVISFIFKDEDCQFSVTFGMDSMPQGFSEPEPGGWKSPQNLDNHDSLFRDEDTNE